MNEQTKPETRTPWWIDFLPLWVQPVVALDLEHRRLGWR